MRRRELIALLGGAVLGPGLGHAQTGQRRARRVGILTTFREENPEMREWDAAFRKRLQELGWAEGGNIRIDYRPAGGDLGRLRAFAKELVEQSPDVILAVTTPSTAALMRETRTIPIVFSVVSDPVGSGFVSSLSRPVGNATGFINIEGSLGGKWLQLLKDVSPELSRAAFLFNPASAPYAHYYTSSFRSAAATAGVEPTEAAYADARGIEAAMASVVRQPGGGLIVMPDTSNGLHRPLILSLAERHRLPSMYPFRFFATDGGLMSYGVDLTDLFVRAASYVDRIRRGDAPADLPVEQPTKFELVINLKTAKALGLTIPPTLLARADEVIE